MDLFFFPHHLDLFKNVTLYDTAPELFYKLTTQSASINLKSQKIFGEESVLGECIYGTFSGQAFMIDKKGKVLSIKGPCTIRFLGYTKSSRR
ncbi:hypothetical protein [Holospora curviuscula]|uniref:Uncharacterized protein n=1 Tax=Holospora curviuscula TaxID=1082868 RepID=A0A2S5R8E7_9PROT|nr:hypothetical protein [Holospora curviuscula]PPE03611.1 hypothetical protein HCUR_00938 [Holospora curviuscula]